MSIDARALPGGHFDKEMDLYGFPTSDVNLQGIWLYLNAAE